MLNKSKGSLIPVKINCLRFLRYFVRTGTRWERLGLFCVLVINSIDIGIDNNFIKCMMRSMNNQNRADRNICEIPQSLCDHSATDIHSLLGKSMHIHRPFLRIESMSFNFHTPFLFITSYLFLYL